MNNGQKFVEIKNLHGRVILTVHEDRLQGAVLSEQDLTGADLRGMDLRHTTFSGAKLRGADLTGALLERVDFTHADLSDAKLIGVKAHKGSFTEAILNGANFTDAELTQTTFRFAKTKGAFFSGANFGGSDISSDIRRAALASATKRCPKGHITSLAGLYTYMPKEGYRQSWCRECRRLQRVEYRLRTTVVDTPKDSCPQGHPYTEENTYIYTDKLGRRRKYCRECANTRSAARRARKAAASEGDSVPMCPQGHLYTKENTYIHQRKDGRIKKYCRECRRVKMAAYNKNRVTYTEPKSQVWRQAETFKENKVHDYWPFSPVEPVEAETSRLYGWSIFYASVKNSPTLTSGPIFQTEQQAQEALDKELAALKEKALARKGTVSEA